MGKRECRPVRGRTCFVTPVHASNSRAVARVVAFWRDLVADLSTIARQSYRSEQSTPSVSHLPHAPPCSTREQALGELRALRDRCLSLAATRSCAGRSETTATESRQKATTLATAREFEAWTGVTKHVRPSNRSALAFSHPVLSEPAMGWAPQVGAPVQAAWPWRKSPFTLPTSQTMAPSLRAGAIVRTRARCGPPARR